MIYLTKRSKSPFICRQCHIEMCTLHCTNSSFYQTKLSNAEENLRSFNKGLYKDVENFQKSVLENQLVKEGLQKSREAYSKKSDLNNQLLNLLYELESTLIKKHKNDKNYVLNENYLLRLGKKYGEKSISYCCYCCFCSNCCIDENHFNVRDIVRKMAGKEIRQQEYQKSTVSLDSQESQSYLKTVLSSVEKLYKKGYLYCYPTNGKMKMVSLCARWHEVKGHETISRSDPKLVEWAEFCKMCSEYIKKDN